MENETIQKLKEIGLTEGEAKVYLALLSGEATRVGLVRKANISPSIVYEVLEKLIRKGLASSIDIEGKKYFYANDPAILLELLEEKKIKIRKLIPLLERQKIKTTPLVKFYKGFQGLKSMLKEVEIEEFQKNKTKEWLAIGVTGYKKELFNRLWMYWHTKIRPKYKVKAKFIFSEKETSYFNSLKRAPLGKIKSIPIPPSTCITIVGKSVLIMKYKEEPSFILIKNEDVAESFRGIFEFLWKMK